MPRRMKKGRQGGPPPLPRPEDLYNHELLRVLGVKVARAQDRVGPDREKVVRWAQANDSYMVKLMKECLKRGLRPQWLHEGTYVPPQTPTAECPGCRGTGIPAPGNSEYRYECLNCGHFFNVDASMTTTALSVE